MKDFIEICKKDQLELKNYLTFILNECGYNVINEDGFIYAKGDINFLLTAHLDTVHKVTCRKVSVINSDKTILSSTDGIGGDDRCGVYIILKILEKGIRPSILFCEDEEIGGIGSKKFCITKYINELSEMNYLIELDRANATDAVFYDCYNDEFIDYIERITGYKEKFGSFSDICNLSPECGIASVNLSCGYYNAHRTTEYVVFEEMVNTINIVQKLLSDSSVKQYEFITENKDMWYEDDYIECEGAEIYYIDKYMKEQMEISFGSTEAKAMFNFFVNHKDICFNDILDYYLF